ncbi:MAG: hypothetical protein O9262_03205, partial [Cyclobacteriaceae bacterium]|nr:hypothetical protein [Cyclobacteriaceae bacterium]
MKKGALATIVCLLFMYYEEVKAQRFFTLNVDSLTRSFMLVNLADDDATEQPVIILLHDSHVLPMSLLKMNWARLQQRPILVFPIALRNQWSCGNDKDSLMMDTNLLLKIIFHVQLNFKTDPSRVFLVGMGDAFCLAHHFSRIHASLVRSAVRWQYPSGKTQKQLITEPTDQLDSVVMSNLPAKLNLYPSLTDNTQQEEPLFKSYKKQTTLSLQAGRWQQSQRSRTRFDSLTMTDLSTYHFMFGIQLAYHVSERWSAYAESHFMIIPREKKINSISWGGGQGVQVSASGKGGLVIPYGMGVRYTFSHLGWRPFLAGTLGGTYLYIGGGTASGGTGGIRKII